VREEQLAKLAALQTCAGSEHKAAPPRSRSPQEPESEFESFGRPAIIAALIRDAYQRPDAGVSEDRGRLRARRTRDDDGIAEDAEGRRIILGKAADLATIGLVQGRRAAGLQRASPGRSVFWDASAAFLADADGG
jgi:hypothetical protein